VAGEASGGFKWHFSNGAFDDIIQSAMWSSWVSDKIVNGVARNPMSLEVLYSGGGGANDIYKRISGAYCSAFSLDAKAGEFVNGSTEFMGMTSLFDTIPVTGATYTAAPTDPILSNVDFASLVTTGGVTIGCISSLSLSVNNNLRAQHCLGAINPTGVGYGFFDVKGTLEFYLSRSEYAMLTSFLAQTTLGLNFTLGTVTLKKTKFDMSSIKISALKVEASAGNQDLMCTCNFEAITNSNGNTLEITRKIV
jgi:hypothetical protein